MRHPLQLFLLLLCATALHAQKKPKPEPEPPKTYPTERIFAASCDAVWPAAIQVLATNGWSIRTSDRTGGLLTFDRTRIETMRNFAAFAAKYTTARTTGFWTQWQDFRFNTSQAVAVPLDRKCSLSFTLVFDGFGKQAARENLQWWSLTSNGWFEDKMLSEIEAKMKAGN
jgi:hypothetical protein